MNVEAGSTIGVGVAPYTGMDESQNTGNVTSSPSKDSTYMRWEYSSGTLVIGTHLLYMMDLP